MTDALALLSTRQKTSPFPGMAGWARALDGKASFADPGSAQAGFDASGARARFLITTARKDRHGDVVVADGCRDSLKDYAANPVVFFGHDSSGLPIGSCKKDNGSVDLEFTEQGTLGWVKFHLKTRVSEEVCALTECGELRGASIGFIPVEAVLHEGKVQRLDEETNVIKFEPFVSFTFTKWNLLEWSVVAVPANADALRCRLDKGIGGKPISEELKGYLSTYAEVGKVWSPGASFDNTSDPANPGLVATGQAGSEGAHKSEEPPAKRAARKPGELFFLRTLSAIDEHRGHYHRAMDDQENPDVVGYCKDSSSAMDKHRKKTLQKAEDLYPEVDFSMPAATCEVEDLVEKFNEIADKNSEQLEEVVASVTTAPEVDFAAVMSALTGLKTKVEDTQKNLRHATGRVS